MFAGSLSVCENLSSKFISYWRELGWMSFIILSKVMRGFILTADNPDLRKSSVRYWWQWDGLYVRVVLLTEYIVFLQVLLPWTGISSDISCSKSQHLEPWNTHWNYVLKNPYAFNWNRQYCVAQTLKFN